MRTKTGWLLLLGLLCMHFTAQAQFLNWTYEDILTDQIFSGANSDVAIASNGDIYMSFWDEASDQLYFAKREKSTGMWSKEIVAPQFAGGFASAIAIDGMGRPHIAFFENVNEEADLVHAYLDGTWQVEYVSEDTLWGSYRRDFELTSFRNPSIDLTFDAQDNPVIAFFDAKVYEFNGCPIAFTSIAPTYYEMDVNIAAKVNNRWQIVDLDLPITTFPSCYIVPNPQDRFGEFCKILATGDSFMVVTNALYNHDLMLFSSTPNDITRWKSIRIDSVERSSNVLIPYEEGFHFPEISVQGDTVLHITHGLSEAYGLLTTKNGSRPDFYRNFFYTQLDLRDPKAPSTFHEFIPPPRDNHMRSFFAMTSQGEDSIYLAYYDLSSRVAVLTSSKDKGMSWTEDTVYRDILTNTPLVCELIGDSLFFGVYNSEYQQFDMAARHVNGQTWTYGLGTQSQQRAYVFSSLVDQDMAGNEAHFIFDEKNSGTLTYGTGDAGNWQYETIDVSSIPLQSADLVLDDQGSPMVAFTQKNQPYLLIANRQAGNWNIDTLPGLSPVENPVLIQSGDSVHAIYLQRNEQQLIHASTSGNGNWVVKTIDSMVITGRPHALTKDSANRLHLAYVQNPGQRIMHAIYENNIWTSSSVTDTFAFTPTSLDIKVRANNDRPYICFRDIVENEIIIFEQKTDSIWNFSTVLTPQQNTLGNSLKLIVDPTFKPWILYSFIGNNEEVRLLRRSNNSSWEPVTVNNNPGKIGGTFDFHLVDKDFYLLGRKTRPGQRGIGLLYAPDGVTTDIEQEFSNHLVTSLFPNPTSGSSTLRFENAFAEILKVDILDMQGRKVASYQLPAQEKSLLLRTESLQTGMYMIHISSSTERMLMKWVVMRSN